MKRKSNFVRPILLTTSSSLILIMTFQSLKLYIDPEITVFESHVMTICFVTTLSGILSYFLLKYYYKYRSKVENKREELEEIINRSPTVAFLCVAKHGFPIEFVSENISQFGYSQYEIISNNTSFINIVSPEDEEYVKDYLSKCVVGKRSDYSLECRIKTKTGGIRWIDTKIWFLKKIDDSNISHFQGIFTDITNRKWAEEALKKSEEKYRYLYESALVGMFKISLKNFELVMFNRTFLNFLGYNQENIDLIINSSKEVNLNNHISREQLKNIIAFFKLQNIIINYELEITRLDNSKIITLINVRHYLEEDSFEGTIIDITYLKNIENTLRNTLKEREELKHQLIQSSKMSAIGEMTAGMAHELYQPMTAILLTAEGLEEQSSKNMFDKDLYERDLKEIINLTNKTVGVIEQLKSFSRPGSKIFTDIQLNEIIQNVLIIFRLQFQSEKIELILKLDENLPLIKGNSNQLEQVITNLLSNSKDALEKSTEKRIEIITKHTNNVILFLINDTGCGIPKKIIKDIFIPFFSTKSRKRGMGLGLSMCYRIIKEHKGKIIVKSREGIGTTFKCILKSKSESRIE